MEVGPLTTKHALIHWLVGKDVVVVPERGDGLSSKLEEWKDNVFGVFKDDRQIVFYSTNIVDTCLIEGDVYIFVDEIGKDVAQ